MLHIFKPKQKLYPWTLYDRTCHRKCRQTVLVSATLRDKLAKLATQLLRDPVAVGLQLRVAADATLQLQELQGAKEESFELPPGLQQLYMDVPTKLRLPTLIGAPSIWSRQPQ